MKTLHSIQAGTLVEEFLHARYRGQLTFRINNRFWEYRGHESEPWVQFFHVDSPGLNRGAAAWEADGRPTDDMRRYF